MDLAVDFALDDTQRAVADLAAGVLRHDHDDRRAVAALETDAGFDETAWKAMAQAGLLGLGLPVEQGGDGVGPVATALVLTEVGRQTLPLPALATLGLAAGPIATFADARQRAAVLPEVVDGRVLTAALRDVPGAPVRLRDGRLHGARTGVPYAAQAHRVLVPTEEGSAVLDPRAAGVTLVRTPSAAGTPEYGLALDGAEPESVLEATPADVDRHVVVGAAAVADGTIAAALDLTATHLRLREQFGRPLATFQAVAQQLADLYVVARTVHLTAVAAAAALDRTPAGADVSANADEDIAVAAYWVAAQLPAALQTCHHLHGGLGVDATYPLHRLYSQGKDLARLLGGAAYRLDAMGARCSSS